MTFFTTPLSRQFVGFESLFDELNEMSARKEPNYPAYNIAKDDDEHYRIEIALAGISEEQIDVQTEKGILTVSVSKAKDNGSYIHQGIAKRAFSKMFRLAEHMKVKGAEYTDGILTIFLQREVPEADRPQHIKVNSTQKKLKKVA